MADSAGGALDYVVENVTGLVVPSDDVDALAAGLNRLAGDVSLRRRIGAAARARLAEQDADAALGVWETVLGPEGEAATFKS